jgi:hypothetical protein
LDTTGATAAVDFAAAEKEVACIAGSGCVAVMEKGTMGVEGATAAPVENADNVEPEVKAEAGAKGKPPVPILEAPNDDVIPNEKGRVDDEGGVDENDVVACLFVEKENNAGAGAWAGAGAGIGAGVVSAFPLVAVGAKENGLSAALDDVATDGCKRPLKPEKGFDDGAGTIG